MYSPARDGISRAAHAVRYTEAIPPVALHGIVCCFWELKTDGELEEDFRLHATPDACVDIMFNELDTNIAGVTGLQTTYTVLNLGRVFNYLGIQFLPGVWCGNRNQIVDHYIGSAYTGNLPLVEANNRMSGLDFPGKQAVMAKLVLQLSTQNIVMRNPLVEKILESIDEIHSVTDMADLAGLSPRHLQRTLKQSTGFTPHDFLKVLRLQGSFRQPDLNAFSDQSHFIRSFRNATGYPPGQYAKTFR